MSQNSRSTDLATTGIGVTNRQDIPMVCHDVLKLLDKVELQYRLDEMCVRI